MEELLEDGMLPPATANEQMMRKFARQRAGKTTLETPQQALDLGAGLLGMVPIVGDAMGLAADLNRYRTEPESRNMLNFGLTGLGLLPLIPGMTVFHGSPHKGIKQFDSSKIGTGEGAQAYGHGLYFAENPEVAGWYKQSTSATRDRPSFQGKAIEDIPGAEGAVAAQLSSDFNDIRNLGHSNPFDTAKVRLRDYLLENNQLEELRILDKMTEADFGLLKHEGQLYKVDIPDEDIARMLDWDAPLKDQPENVRKALEKIGVGKVTLRDGMDLAGGGKLRVGESTLGGPEYFLEMGTSKFRLSAKDVERLVGTGAEGKSIYQELRTKLGSDKAASEYLQELGIPGLKYYDQGSRAKGGTRNIVVFDDKLPKILDE